MSVVRIGPEPLRDGYIEVDCTCARVGRIIGLGTSMAKAIDPQPTRMAYVGRTDRQLDFVGGLPRHSATLVNNKTITRWVPIVSVIYLFNVSAPARM